MAEHRLGVDIGGTFTDVVLLRPDGALWSKKVLSTPDDYSRAIEDGIRAVFDESRVSAAVVTIEKGGMNDRGYLFGTRGTELVESHVAKADYLVREAQARGIATLGVGDGGNEIGFGIIEDGIKKHIPYGAEARVEGRGGIAAHTATDAMVAAAISNWGAYGIAACLAARLKDPTVFHDAAVEERVLRESANASFIDGVTGWVEPSADGLPSSIHQAYVTLMGETVKRAVARLNG